MRKALIAIAVATALFAVGAFAASFAVNSEDIASGSNPTTNCASDAVVNFNEAFDQASNNWNVSTITVTLNNAQSCVGADAQLVLQSNASTEPIVFDDTQTIATTALLGSTVTLTYTPSTSNVIGHAPPLTVGEVWNSAILIDNLNIPVVLP